MLCGSGSLALEMALRACEVEPGDEVVLPTFCCTAVVTPVLAVGAKPVLADVGEQLNMTAATAEAVLTKKTKAIIVPHLFGNPAEIDAIVELGHVENIRVVDDAAQALGATVDGQAVGSFGDAGVLSFGAEKVCFGLGGGALVSRRKEALDGIAQIELSKPKRVPTIDKFLSTLTWRRWRRWTLPLRCVFGERPAEPDSRPTPYRREAMSNLAAAVASSMMQTLRANISARRRRAQAYRELLGNCPSIELVSHRTGSACLAQVIRVAPRSLGEDLATRLIGTLGAAGYEVQGSYVPIHLLAQFDRCVWDRLPHAERLWGDLVELPCEPDMSLNDLEQIAAIVRKTAGE